jgi:predicted dehydrogenase
LRSILERCIFPCARYVRRRLLAPVRIAVIGAGVIGRRHAEIIAALPECRLAGIADPSDAGQELAQTLDVPWRTEAAELLDTVRPDAAIIATPNALHLPMAEACIARGIAMLVEKPLAETLTAAQTLAQAAAFSGVPLLVGHFRRHNPVLRRARELVQEGRLGRLLTVNASSNVLKPDAYFDVAWRRRPGGGPVLINLVHDIDALRFVCGEIASVQAVAANTARGFAVEDSAAVLLRFRDGALGVVTLSDATPSPWCWDQSAGENPAYPVTATECYRLCGTMASLALPTLDLWSYPGERGWHMPLRREALAVQPADPLVEQMRHFVRVVRREEPPLVSGEDGARTLAATLAVTRSAETGGPVALDA